MRWTVQKPHDLSRSLDAIPDPLAVLVSSSTGESTHDSAPWHSCRDTSPIFLKIPRGGEANDKSDDSEEHDRPSSEHRKSSRKNKSNKAHQHGSTAAEKSEGRQHKRKSHGKMKDSEKKDASKQPSSSVPPIVEEILREEDYYAVLGLDKQAVLSHPSNAADKIKKAYRRRALQTHPDKTNGDRRAFDKVAEAYDVLSDEDKRKMYNRFGKKGVDQHASGMHNTHGGFATAEDLFRSFFGGGMPSSQSRGSNPFMRRNRTLRYQLEVTLEDLYQGSKREILVAPPGVAASHHTKRVQVQIPRGALSGQTIVLSGEMDFDVNETPGDLVFEVRQRMHRTFTRKNHDLAVSFEIRLKEALTGVRRKIRFLDGQDLVLESARRGDNNDPIVIKDGDVHVLKGHGMPKSMHGHEFGDLYVQYKVVNPQAKGSNSLSAEEREQLGFLLDKLEGVSSSSEPLSNEEALHLKPGHRSDFGVASGQPDPQSFHGEDDDAHDSSPFSGPHSQFFFSSATSSNPFFGMRQEGRFNEEDMDGNMQCQQM